MCQDHPSIPGNTPASTHLPVAAGSPTRRAFAQLLATGVGLATLAACAPEPGQPMSSASGGSATASTATTAVASETTTADGSGGGTSPAVSPQSATPDGAPVQAAQAAAPYTSLGVRHSLDDPASPWVVVNKRRPLTPLQYVPADLVQPAVALAVSGEASMLNRTTAAAAEPMFAAAARDGSPMALASGYRSFTTQVATYSSYASTRGQESADTASARPGFSEHQTGWAFDIADASGACSFDPCFADQPAAAWAKSHAHEFGFVVRYPCMLHGITGYYYEPWHLRYVGVEASADMHARGIQTLEEYFGVGPAPGYL